MHEVSWPEAFMWVGIAVAAAWVIRGLWSDR